MEENIRTKILTVGEENANGFIYSKEMAESIIGTFQEEGYILGIQGSLENGDSLPVTEVTHQVVNVFLVDDKDLIAEIKILDTPVGQEFKEFYKKNKDNIVFKPEGTGEIDNNSKLIYDYTVNGINAILKSEIENKNNINNNED